MTNLDKIFAARRYAMSNHQRVHQLYAGLPYHVHLLGVVDFVNKFAHLLTDDELTIAICAAWLHDTIEDTGITFNDLWKEMGDEKIADIVYRLTNLRGKTRAERANDEYYAGIIEEDIAIFVKLCDRLFNMFFSHNHGSERMKKMYQKERPEFKAKLYNGKFDEMWNLLDNIETITIDKDYFHPKIEQFDEESIYRVKLPQPVPFALYDELYRKGIIRKSDLVKNRYYRGKCRNAKVALWNGFEFVYMRFKHGEYRIDAVNHLEDDNGLDLFVPLRVEENPEENQRVKY